MAEVTDTDPLAIRGRILKEFGKVQTEIATNPKLWRSVAFRAHKRICEAMGYDYVDYPEFEFWFLRFLQGNFDWGYDRSSDPKPQSLANLPLDIFENVGEYLDIVDRLRLSDVCKDFRAQVDNWDLKKSKCFSGIQNAKKVRQPLQNFHWMLYTTVPGFTLRLRGIPAEDLKSDKLKAQFLKTLMEYGKVQKCVLYISKFRSFESQIMNYFNEPEAMVFDCPSLRRYPIPGTNDFYELEYREEGNGLWDQSVRLERKQ